MMENECPSVPGPDTFTIVILMASVLSLNGSAMMLISFLRSDKSRVISKIILILALGDFFWALDTIIYQSMLYLVGNIGLCWEPACIFSRAMFQFWSMSTVLSILSLSLFIFLYLYYPRSQKFLQTDSFPIFAFIIYSLSAATTLTLTFWGPMKVDRFGWCIPPDVPHTYLWFLPIGIAFVISTSLYFAILVKYFVVKDHSSNTPNSKDQRYHLSLILSSYVLAFIFTWGFDLVEFIFWQSGNELMLLPL
eukprot:TRINITY_DN4522_c0_g1_i1.p1 TRINITY_DN4522_c0_g1~~TRINITY_DN4522_c0_g1_i1.p1  ORF type:complete len:250 (-),score=-6.54 TRINITY_DN4522_c0_g1_i1:51-800(-)